MSQKRYSEMFFRKQNKYIIIIEKLLTICIIEEHDLIWRQDFVPES